MEETERPKESFDEFLLGLFGKEGLERLLNPIRSEYQKRLEESGWIFVTNEIATNYHLGLDYPALDEPIRDSLKRLREDCPRRYPGKRVRFARAYNVRGERIPSYVPEGFFDMDVAMVAIYVKEI